MMGQETRVLGARGSKRSILTFLLASFLRPAEARTARSTLSIHHTRSRSFFRSRVSWYNTIRLRILKVFAADCRARRRPSLFAWTRREYGLQGSPFSCSSLVFQRRRKAPLEGGDSRKTRRVAKRFCDETSRKSYRLRGNARICRGVSVKCNGSAEYAFDILWNYGRSCWESENYTFVAETSASLLGY